MYLKLDETRREVATIRWEICQQCPLLNRNRNQCAPPWKGGCGCFLHSDKPLPFPLKTEKMRARCPQGKW